MKNKIKLFTFFLMAGVAFNACEDYRDQFLDKYDTINYFKDSGEIPIIAYNVGEDTKYQLTVNKGGSEIESESSVQVTTMTEPVLQIYNEENYTDYVLLPDNAYQFDTQAVTLTEEYPWQEIEVVLKPDVIIGLDEISGTYVLPLELINSEDSINSEKRYSFLAPKIMTPTVFFPESLGEDVIFMAEDEPQISFSFSVAIPSDLDNKWELDCSLEIDETLVEQYNQTYGANYALLPSDAYTMENVATILPGEQEGEVEVTIDRTSLLFGNYVLPLKLAGCSKPEFEIEEERGSFMVPVSYTPPVPSEIPLNADMVSSNADEPYEGPIENLVDGDTQTYFHSVWSIDVFSPYGHYIDIELEEEINIMQFAYVTRHNNANGAPKHIIVYTSSDGQNWNQLTDITRGLPQGAEESYTSLVYSTEENFRYVRISVMESAGGMMNEQESAFFALSELQFFGELFVE
ncbi:uncharacterized protein DUF1735 [Marinilabilia salmonicolor]|jgi:hypothetical protein|uniref:BT_3987 domain-containing protein n=1 Tax=Marinilabilia salmonicolor TaxID=989 RepID=UPI000D055C11|nr:DUF1735 domain-containing protein [Marinilabilia salmonicolor]PRY97342.1 uncharacterized protein DUF1735 [Marinilabilia salmonicolor]